MDEVVKKKRKSIFLAILTGGGRTTADNTESVLRLAIGSIQGGLGLEVIYGAFSGVDRSRNIFAHRFLNHSQTDADYLLFVDSDVKFQTEDIITMVQAMENPEFGVIGGAYPKKNIDFQLLSSAVKNGIPPEELSKFSSSLVININNEQIKNPITLPGVTGTFYEAETVGTGMMLIKKEVLLKFQNIYKSQIEYTTDYETEHDPIGTISNMFFSCALDPQNKENKPPRYLTEDWNFCRMCWMMGQKVHVFADMKLQHAGSFKYEGCLAEHLKYNTTPLQGVPDKSE